MNTLIDKVLSVESEAGTLIEKARVDAKDLEKRSNADIAAIHDETAAKVEGKIAAFREEAMGKHKDEVAKQEADARATLEEADRIPAALIAKQVEKIVARFREI